MSARTKSKPARLAQQARDRGFDESRVEDGTCQVACSQCVAAVINNMPCHEEGCPNARRHYA